VKVVVVVVVVGTGRDGALLPGRAIRTRNEGKRREEDEAVAPLTGVHLPAENATGPGAEAEADGSGETGRETATAARVETVPVAAVAAAGAGTGRRLNLLPAAQQVLNGPQPPQMGRRKAGDGAQHVNSRGTGIGGRKWRLRCVANLCRHKPTPSR
jgi:hypothetical protein